MLRLYLTLSTQFPSAYTTFPHFRGARRRVNQRSGPVHEPSGSPHHHQVQTGTSYRVLLRVLNRSNSRELPYECSTYALHWQSACPRACACKITNPSAARAEIRGLLADCARSMKNTFNDASALV
jgi:hypothetical protein